MLRFYAATFLSMMSNLSSVFMLCHDENFEMEDVQAKSLEHISAVREALMELQLPSLVAESDRFLKRLPTLSRDQISILLCELRDSIQHEFTNHLFLDIGPGFKWIFLKPAPPDEIVNSFSSTIFEFEDASRNLALDQPTAAVFHLMRALETGLNALANHFNVSFERRNWQNIINDVECEIQKIGPANGENWKNQEQFYSDAASHFRFLKNAWRNYVMHVHQRYSITEASKIRMHVLDFMQHLSSKLNDSSL